MRPGAIFQDDKATPHRARVVTAFLQQHQVTGMNWPARSADVAPIEHICDILGHRVDVNHLPAVNLAQFFQFLQQEWNAIPQRNLVTLM